MLNMDFSCSLYASCGLMILVLLLIFQYHRNIRKKYVGFPTRHHIIPYIAYSQVTGKVPKSIPMSSFIFQEVVDMCLKRREEGLLLTYGFQPCLYIFGEEFIKFFSSEKAAVDKPYPYKILGDVLGHGLVTSNGERWKKHRKLINPAFHVGMLKAKLPLFNEHALALVKDFETLLDKPSADVSSFIKRRLLDSLCESVLGLKQSDENKAETGNFFYKVDFLSEMTVYRCFHPWFYWECMMNLAPVGKKYKEAKNFMHEFSKNVILEMKNLVLSKKSSETEVFSENTHKSFTHILLEQHLNDPSFTFQDLQDEVNTILAAGYDTVSYTMLWCLFMLGLYPEVQEKAFNEVQYSSDSYITYKESCSFTYLESVIMETLRLYPTIPLFGRHLCKDVQCGKYRIPKDTTLLFFPYVLHRNPELYPDPEKFDPDRFSSEVSRKSWTHIPFAEGNRSCIGKRYALIEMKIFLAHILRNFKITSLDKREDIALNWKVVLSPAKPFRMHIAPRYSQAFPYGAQNI